VENNYMILVQQTDNTWHRIQSTPQLDAGKVAQLIAAGIWTASDYEPHGITLSIKED